MEKEKSPEEGASRGVAKKEVDSLTTEKAGKGKSSKKKTTVENLEKVNGACIKLIKLNGSCV